MGRYRSPRSPMKPDFSPKLLKHFCARLTPQELYRSPAWLGMYLCGANLLCLEPLVFWQFQMRHPGYDLAQVQPHGCSCCKETPLVAEHVHSTLELCKRLFQYHFPMEHNSADCTGLNTFTGTAKDVYGPMSQGKRANDYLRAITLALDQGFCTGPWPRPSQDYLAAMAARLHDMHQQGQLPSCQLICLDIMPDPITSPEVPPGAGGSTATGHASSLRLGVWRAESAAAPERSCRAAVRSAARPALGGLIWSRWS